MSAALLYESHLHTPLCKHAAGLPGDYAAVAQQKNLKGIIVTCHAPMPDGYSSPYRMKGEQWDEYVGMVAQATEEYIEAFYKGTWPMGDPETWLDFQRTYFGHLADAAETGLYDTISHPDLVKNMCPQGWDVGVIMDDVRRALDRIAKAGTAMELNTSGRYKTVPEFNPGLTILHEMQTRGIPVVLGADAHQPKRVADLYPEALQTLQEAEYCEVSFFLNRQRQIVPIKEVLASLVPMS